MMPFDSSSVLSLWVLVFGGWLFLLQLSGFFQKSNVKERLAYVWIFFHLLVLHTLFLSHPSLRRDEF